MTDGSACDLPANQIDRALQREMLESLRQHYPQSVRLYSDADASQAQRWAANLIYLEEHGLCRAGIKIGLSGDYIITRQTITARGIDFLEQDGGLAAILGTVTVKMHADTLRDLIAAKVDQSDATPAEKHTIKERLASLSEAGLRAATTDLVQQGLHSLPDAAAWLGRILGL